MTELTIDERLRRLSRTAEMSAGIMRDPERTGGWPGAEKTAMAFDRIKDTVDEIRAALPPVAPAGDDLVCDCQQWPTHVSNECPVHNLFPDPPPEPAAPSGDREAVYWEHRLVIEGQVCGTHVSKSPNHDFGVQGEDFDPSAIVETAPLYAAAPAQPAEEKAAREAEAWHYEMGPNRMCYILHGYQVWAHVYRDPQTGEAGQIVRAEKIVAALSRARTGSEAQ